jgi:hypothetical protein
MMGERPCWVTAPLIDETQAHLFPDATCDMRPFTSEGTLEREAINFLMPHATGDCLRAINEQSDN